MHDVVVSRESEHLGILPFATDLRHVGASDFSRTKMPQKAVIPIHRTTNAIK